MIHSVVISRGGGDIDHVVVGTPGVFTLNTKHHPEKTVWVSGDVYSVDWSTEALPQRRHL